MRPRTTLHDQGCWRNSMAAHSAAADAAAARHPAALFGVAGVLVLLVAAVVRLTPMALTTFQCRDPEGASIVRSIPERAGYMLMVVLFGYAEGYKALCVQRALTLSHPNCSPIHRLLAPFYVLGLVASRQRLFAWTVVVLMSVLVVLVRHVPYPQRSLIDAGVVISLGWGATVVLALYVRALAGFGAPGVDAQLPDGVGLTELASADEELGANEGVQEETPSAQHAIITRALILLPLVLLLLALLLAGLAPGGERGMNDLDAARTALEATASSNVRMANYITGVCAHFCIPCPQAPTAAEASQEWYAATKNDGSLVDCIPSTTRDGRLCFCDDS